MKKKNRKSTVVELVDELRKMRTRLGQCPWLEQMIQEAKAGEYHDYKNQKYACGKMAVVDHLRKLKMPEADDLALRVIDGEFDEEADAQDLKEMRNMLKEQGLLNDKSRKLFGL